MSSQLFLDDGGLIGLGERIGRGGEGDVHAITGDPIHAVKIYTVKEIAERQAKVAAMVRAGLAARSDLVAFPVAIVNRAGGKFAGFTMRRVTGRKPLHELYSPGARKAAFPRADYRFLVRTAANIARAIGAVHETGCVIGDINHSGILISDTATVALIDADSFQYVEAGRRHACRVGVPEYTPPELQGVPLHSVERTVEHDRFGLAVVMFQLLFMGRHPFSGAYSAGEMPIERAIGEHRFAYTRQRNVGMRPPPVVPTLADMPPPIAVALEGAFAPGPTGQRPTAAQWVNLLAEMEKGLKVCARSPLHHYAPNAAECPWCRMESKQGIVLFLPYAPGGPTVAPSDPGAAAFDLQAAWRNIQSVAPPSSTTPEPRLPNLALAPSDSALAARRNRRVRKLLGVGGILAAIGILMVAVAVFPAWIAAAWFGLAKLFGDDKATKEIKREKAEVDRRYQGALAEWQGRASAKPFHDKLGELNEARLTYSRLGEIERQKVAEYQRNRRAEQLKQYLDSFLIRRQKIKGVGPGRVATLASYGIETALDVTQSQVLNVPGFGPKTAEALVIWRRQLEARFVYNERPNAADTTRMAAIRAEMVKQATDLRRTLLAGSTQLARIRADIDVRRNHVDPQLMALHERGGQLAIDLTV